MPRDGGPANSVSAPRLAHELADHREPGDGDDPRAEPRSADLGRDVDVGAVPVGVGRPVARARRREHRHERRERAERDGEAHRAPPVAAVRLARPGRRRVEIIHVPEEVVDQRAVAHGRRRPRRRPARGLDPRDRERGEDGERREHDEREAERAPARQVEAAVAQVREDGDEGRDEEPPVRGRVVKDGRRAPDVLEEEERVDRVVDDAAHPRAPRVDPASDRSERGGRPRGEPRGLRERGAQLRGHERLGHGPDQRHRRVGAQRDRGAARADDELLPEGPARHAEEGERDEARQRQGRDGLGPTGRLEAPAPPAARRLAAEQRVLDHLYFLPMLSIVWFFISKVTKTGFAPTVGVGARFRGTTCSRP